MTDDEKARAGALERLDAIAKAIRDGEAQGIVVAVLSVSVADDCCGSAYTAGGALGCALYTLLDEDPEHAEHYIAGLTRDPRLAQLIRQTLIKRLGLEGAAKKKVKVAEA